MSRLAQLEELESAIENAAKITHSELPSSQVATELCRSHRDLIEPWLWEWAAERIANRIRQIRAAERRRKDRQLVFEYALGFMRIPRKIDVDGKRVYVGEATRDQFARLKGQIRRAKVKTIEPILQEITRGDSLFGHYTKQKGHQHITWSEVIAKEAKKAIQQGLFDEPDFD